MKKILLILLFCEFVLVGYSQTNFSEYKHTNISASIDSLQNEYNFLKCEFEIYRLSNGLSDLGRDIGIRCNYIDIKRYHEMFYELLYDALEDDYNACIRLKTEFEDTYRVLKEYYIPIYYDNFSTSQKDLIDSCFIIVDKAIKRVDQSLKVYRISLDIYKNKE